MEWCNQSNYIRHVGIVLTEIFKETGTNFLSCRASEPRFPPRFEVVRQDGCEIENKRGDG